MLGVAPVLGLRCLLVLAMLGWKRIHTMVRASRRRTLFLMLLFFSLSPYFSFAGRINPTTTR